MAGSTRREETIVVGAGRAGLAVRAPSPTRAGHRALPRASIPKWLRRWQCARQGSISRPSSRNCSPTSSPRPQPCSSPWVVARRAQRCRTDRSAEERDRSRSAQHRDARSFLLVEPGTKPTRGPAPGPGPARHRELPLHPLSCRQRGARPLHQHLRARDHALHQLGRARVHAEHAARDRSESDDSTNSDQDTQDLSLHANCTGALRSPGAPRVLRCRAGLAGSPLPARSANRVSGRHSRVG